MRMRSLLTLMLLWGCFSVYSQTPYSWVDIDEQTQNRALTDTFTYKMYDFEKIDFSEVEIIEELFQIPSYHIYNKLWDTIHIRSAQLEIPFYQNSLKIRLVENNNNPFAFPCTGTLLLDYGLINKVFHAGVDFSVVNGAPIVSCFDGVVRLAKYYGDYGKVIVIRHYNGLETVFAHLSDVLVIPGQIIKAGDLIGTCGKSGNTPEPILHFEIRLFNELINPNKVIDFINRRPVDNLIEIRPEDCLFVSVIAQDSICQNPVVLDQPIPERQIDPAVYHVVKNGDTLFKIARIYNTTPEAIIKLNKLKGDGSNLQLDQKLRVQ